MANHRGPCSLEKCDMAVIVPLGAKCLSIKKSREKLSKGNSWIWDRIKNDPTFPKPIYLSPRSPVLIEQQLDEWLEQRANSRPAA